MSTDPDLARPLRCLEVNGPSLPEAIDSIQTVPQVKAMAAQGTVIFTKRLVR